MRQIERLDASVASRIAAGEVVERPVSAAKELLENAIDAGAGDIRIALEQGGKVSLVVEDDGCGIPFDELPLALERHATSKIRTLDDLERVRTLGYRGEALSSVAAVSRLELRSRAKGSDMGGMIRCEGGRLLPPVEMPGPFGTRVQVDDLFFNLPARRKFLRGAAAELKRILQVAQDYALVHPKVRFRVMNDGKQLLDIGDAESTDEVLRNLWGAENRALCARSERDGVSAALWWNNLPGSRRVNVTAFVNGRRVQDPTIRSALNSTGASIYGEWVVMVTLPPEDVDVNIHPAKAEVRFRRSGPIFELVRRGTQELLLSGGGFSDPRFPAAADRAETAGEPQGGYVPVFVDPSKKREFFSPIHPAGTAESAPPSAANLLFQKSATPVRRYLGQTQGGFLVFDDERGLCLLDAHAAHERILYEEIEDSFAKNRIPLQQLAFGQEVPPGIVPDVLLRREELRDMGFTFKLPDEDPDVSVPTLSTVPALRGLARLSPIEMLRSALRGLEEETDPSKRDREVWWRWARTACRDAIKLGDTVEREEALELFERLERCRSPYSCPHGRPTTIFLADEKLRSWFDR